MRIKTQYNKTRSIQYYVRPKKTREENRGIKNFGGKSETEKFRKKIWREVRGGYFLKKIKLIKSIRKVIKMLFNEI